MTSIPNNYVMWDELLAYANRTEDLLTVVNRLNNLVLLPPSTNSSSWLQI